MPFTVLLLMYIKLLDTSLMRGGGAYYVPNVHKRGHICKTNICSPTAFRGFGSPQPNIVIETIIHSVAKHLRKPVMEVFMIIWDDYIHFKNMWSWQWVIDHLDPYFYQIILCPHKS